MQIHCYFLWRAFKTVNTTDMISVYNRKGRQRRKMKFKSWYNVAQWAIKKFKNKNGTEDIEAMEKFEFKYFF